MGPSVVRNTFLAGLPVLQEMSVSINSSVIVTGLRPPSLNRTNRYFVAVHILGPKLIIDSELLQGMCKMCVNGNQKITEFPQGTRFLRVN